MAKLLSLKLQDKVFQDTEEVLRHVQKPRNTYLNEAVNFYNHLWRRKILKEVLVRESAMVADDSLEVLEAFEQLGDELTE
jgi:hypothetical protein